MAWDEWNQLKAEASGTSSTRMQLNRVPDEPDGKTLSTNSQGDLKVVNEHLSKIGDHAFGLYNRLWREGRVAEATTDSAASDLSGQGFDLGGALSHVSLKWASALADLMDACAHISNHMDYTKNAHAGDEIFIERRMSSIAMLDGGFDERASEPGKPNDLVYGNKEDKGDKKDGE
ncbi:MULTISPECIES: hypothetical protein [Streptomyces]|uniref:AG1 protein n=1 Tax=Streptomyces hydrogenans TaxID=1873719 RepID=A0ABQ3P6A3_9ACTN|nr:MULTISPECIES: hypothetical protein [Streptomyces]GHG21851.1 hypothetical protein GCM10018784_38940 [Streptomyces hydrogenans]GHI20551.1 hypothetical protein Shyd_19220 [Streptomyces hydrogenans]GHI23423.1 hypothetical protein Shyd_47940 [Streptomyces hydrogenans]GHI23456.1 hypothetical protein Shyd_48270 [Streptomyces hydrogenans]